ncbi:Anion transporter [uncultured Desulfobacterium sp.]|uniref:Anion transporter n=1 Tax=uncultured Desulfobacterium sp. TaxID=201089 RepID=A0A445N171_9BACT|nr:Anion transporter [uncultured Desulfobacterium sp.]
MNTPISSDSGSFQAVEAISITEQHFDRIRRTVSLFLGPIVFLVLLSMPMPSLSDEAHRLSAVVGLVLVYWVGEALPIPVTSLLGPVLCIVMGIATPASAFAPFANPIIFLFIGSFILAQGMMEQKLDKRIALAILSFPWIGDSPSRLLVAIAVIPVLTSMWISDSATTAMIYPILIGIISAFRSLAHDADNKLASAKFNCGLLLTIAYAALIGGVGTPIGTPPNLIGIGMIDKLLNIKIHFFKWMMLAVPIMLVMWTLMVLYMRMIHPPAVKKIPGLVDFLRKQKAHQGPFTRGQKNALFAFIVAVVLWVFPGVVASFLGTESQIYKFCESHLPEGVASLIAAILLFLLPVDWKERRFTLAWTSAVKIDWGTVLLFGGGLSLGSLMFSTGLANIIGKNLISFSGASSLWTITAIAIALAIVSTEMTSNTAAANMLIPIMIAVSQGAGVSAIPPAIGVCFGASMAFMMPVSTPSNAIIYGSGLVPITTMIRAGLVLDIVSFFVIFTGMRMLCPLLGLV